ncbi:MAG: TauD/TfdA family dioxygenase [Novosphingobium sp.]
MTFSVAPLEDGLRFGARVSGLARPDLQNAAVAQELRAVFERDGLIVFEDVEPTAEMHVALSTVFGPLKDHPVKAVDRVDGDAMPGVIDMHRKPFESSIVEIDGVQLTGWLPWHFDHCYNDQLNRAGVLRAIEIPPSGGITAFADGIEMYANFPKHLSDALEGANIIYTLDLIFDHMRFGLPDRFRSIQVPPKQYEFLEQSKKQPRAIHPAIWTRADGTRVLHVSPWMSVGIEGRENDEGDALLRAVCHEINRSVRPYRHSWTGTEMLVWDNWRMLHAVSGNPPEYGRRMQRTTIQGDYGLGYFEGGRTGSSLLEMTV